MLAASKLAQSFLILAGSFTNNISTFEFTPNSYASTLSLGGLSNAPNPGWIGLNPTDKRILFSTGSYGNGTGSVASYTIDSKGLLTTVGQQSSNGDDPAHLLAIPSGEVIEPNYTSGSVQSHVLAADGVHFDSYGNEIQFVGTGPVISRQGSAHPHEAYQYGDEIFIPDLGSDRVWRLGRVVGTSVGQWQLNGYIQQPAGSGPRHIQTIGNTLYALHELTNTITQQTIPTKPGNDFPTLIANVSTLPADVPAGSTYTAAELLVSPETAAHGNGTKECARYLYASNRNISPNMTQLDALGDTIAVFATYPRLHVVNQVHTSLQQIRGMMLSNDGKYMAAAGLAGGGMAVFEVTEGGANLELKARYTGPGSVQLTSFVWL